MKSKIILVDEATILSTWTSALIPVFGIMMLLFAGIQIAIFVSPILVPCYVLAKLANNNARKNEHDISVGKTALLLSLFYIGIIGIIFIPVYNWGSIRFPHLLEMSFFVVCAMFCGHKSLGFGVQDRIVFRWWSGGVLVLLILFTAVVVFFSVAAGMGERESNRNRIESQYQATHAKNAAHKAHHR